MDTRTYSEIERLNNLNQLLIETCAILASRGQRVGLPGMPGLAHTSFVPGVFGGMAPMTVDPRSVVDYSGISGFRHSPYDNYGNVYPFGYTQSIAGWPVQNVAPTHINPFERTVAGFTHTSLPTTPWTLSPYELERQRQFQALLARQQYEAMANGWRTPFGI